MTNEVYESSTHGPIPLSFTGRRLLANLRDAITDAIEARDYNAEHEAVARARGEIAKRMSELEDRTTPWPEKLFGDKAWPKPGTVFFVDSAAHLTDFMKPPRSPEQEACDEFLDAAAEFNAARVQLLRTAKQCQSVGLAPTWQGPPRPFATSCLKPFLAHMFPQLKFKVERKIKTERIVVDEQTEVMGTEPKS